jgi:RNA polymerase sporulation-specific sigma factor
MESAKKQMITFVELEALTDEELIEIYRSNDLMAIEVLVKRYKPFVRKKIKTNYFIGADKEDLLQEGMIGLFKAICDYDASKDASFKSFSSICITRQLSTAFKSATRQKHMPLNTSISLNIPINEGEEETITLMDTLKAGDESNPEDFMIHKEELSRLKKHIKESLSPLEWKVITLHTQGKDYHEIAKEMNKPIKSIDNALQRIKRKIAEYR